MNKQALKIVHISTYDSGGAGSAAIRLHQALIKEGVDSKVICLQKQTTSDSVIKFVPKKNSLLRRLLLKLKIIQTKASKNQQALNKVKGEFEIFTFAGTDHDILQNEYVQGADVIHLHWVSYFLDYASFFKKVKQPVIWTLHDKNPVLGGFHLLLDKWKNPQIEQLEKEVAKKKLKSIHGFKNLCIVCPSDSLLRYSQKSDIFNGYPHYKIANSIDTEIFTPAGNIGTLSPVIIPDKINILFLNVPYFHKGTDVIWKCLDNNNFKNLFFIGIGKSAQVLPANVALVDNISYESSLSELYAACDYFILPSREDNLPNMMLESLSCGDRKSVV